MILSLDIARVTGWARRTEEGIIFGTHSFDHLKRDHAFIGRRLHWWLVDLIIEQGKPSEIVIEKPFFNRKFPLAGILLHKLCHEVHRVAELQGIPRTEYEPKVIKKFITGNGGATKSEVMEAVKALGHNIITEHDADAVALLLLHEEKQNQI